MTPLANSRIHSPGDIRCARAAELARALLASRKDTLATFQAFRSHRPSLQVPYHPWLNPPLWELGHIGWFQEFWTSRNSDQAAGHRADPNAERRPGVRAESDTLYNSSVVPHRSRWSLPLPTVAETLDDLARQLETTLEALMRADDDDRSLYFFRLVLLHEDMHHEAAIYMAQALDVPVYPAVGFVHPMSRNARRTPLTFDGASRRFGFCSEGFAFDNELPPFAADVDPFTIDSNAVPWFDFLPFVDDDGYERRALWSEDGWRWREGNAARRPRYLSREDGIWHTKRFGRLLPLDVRMPACHLTFYEAEAWCRWAARRLPTEFEWEAAASQAPAEFTYGQVWEWTGSPFVPYVGFEPHPYRDYSAPWFDGRPVLRGASFATQPRMRCLHYRNFFPAERNDIFAGFRSCAVR